MAFGNSTAEPKMGKPVKGSGLGRKMVSRNLFKGESGGAGKLGKSSTVSEGLSRLRGKGAAK